MEHADSAFLYTKENDENETFEQQAALRLHDVPLRRVLMKH